MAFDSNWQAAAAGGIRQLKCQRQGRAATGTAPAGACTAVVIISLVPNNAILSNFGGWTRRLTSLQCFIILDFYTNKSCQPCYMASATRSASAASFLAQVAQDPSYRQSRHPVPSGSTLAASLPASSTVQYLQQNDSCADRAHSDMHSSRTWASTSGDVGLLNDADEVEDRNVFVLEYNRLAKKV